MIIRNRKLKIKGNATWNADLKFFPGHSFKGIVFKIILKYFFICYTAHAPLFSKGTSCIIRAWLDGGSDLFCLNMAGTTLRKFEEGRFLRWTAWEGRSGRKIWRHGRKGDCNKRHTGGWSEKIIKTLAMCHTW